MELSLVANFDDLRRCNDVLTDGTAEIGKIEIAIHVSVGQFQWLAFYFL